MIKISLFKVGLVAMLFFVIASNVLNYVSIGTNTWTEDTPTSLWSSCIYPPQNNLQVRPQCYLANPPALLATGTALNCLSLILIFVSQVALCVPRFRDSFALYFVFGSLVTTLLSLVFNSTGWYFTFIPQYQALNGGVNGVTPMFKHGWSFWLMTPSFGCSVIAGLIGACILGCTCVTNRYERNKRLTTPPKQQQQQQQRSYGLENPGCANNPMYYPNDPQVLRL